MPSTTLTGAVLPVAPAEYDQENYARLIDVVQKIVEQLSKPAQVTAATLILTDLPHETPRQDVEGEVYTVASGSHVLLAIDQQNDENESRKRGRKLWPGRLDLQI